MTFFEAMMDSEDPSYFPEPTENSAQLVADAERIARETYDDNEVLVVEKSYKEYVKEINLLRANLRYIKKSVSYRGGYGCTPYDNQKDIIDLEHQIKRLCKLRKQAKEMEKVKEAANG